MIPKLSLPNTKAIRTLEGILLSAATIVTWAATFINPASLSHGQAEKWTTIYLGILALSRTIIKTFGTPVTVSTGEVSSVVNGADQSASEILAALKPSAGSPPDGKG